MKEVATIQIPGTTANLGPGFDALGIALNIHNRLIIKKKVGSASYGMIGTAAHAFFEHSHQKPFQFSCHVEGEVPRSRGLGSSVTIRLGVLMGLNILSGEPLSTEQIYQICVKLEGHPDNAAAAISGGFTIARKDLVIQKFEVSSRLHFLLLIPDFEVRTAEARMKMPFSIPLKDAALSITNTAWIAAAFASQNYAALRGGFEDRLHQPYRLPLIPFLNDVLHAAEKAGALGGWLSGSGSTITCITLEDPSAVSDAMRKAAPQGAQIVHTTVDNQGACAISNSDEISDS